MSSPTSLVVHGWVARMIGMGSPLGRLVDQLGRQLAVGHLTMTLPKGEILQFAGAHPGPQAQITLHRPRVLSRLLLDGAVGFGESYLDGDWDSPDLATLLEFADRNTPALGRWTVGGSWSRLLKRLHHWRNDNSRRGSRRNIAAHYDLGNRFYETWLDPSMTYSAALYQGQDLDLMGAQQAKYHALAQDLGLRPGHRLLEIGCGWGGFAEIAARDYGASVVGLTLSVEQRDWAMARIAKAGLSDRVEIRLQDYRDILGSFDRIVSIEMIEAVGERWWPTYFGQIRRCLAVGGRAALQAITIASDRFDSYRTECDFIQRHVFPGGMLPTEAAIHDHARAVGLTARTRRRFGTDYERTLAQWNSCFQARWPDVAQLGFDRRFKRLWEFYLAYCQAGFRTAAIDVCHLTLDHG